MRYYGIVEKITTTPRKINCSVRMLTIRTATWLVKSLHVLGAFLFGGLKWIKNRKLLYGLAQHLLY